MCAKNEEYTQKAFQSKQLPSIILTRNCHGSHSALATDKNLETVEACFRLALEVNV